MDHIVIDGVAPYDGRWPFDIEGAELTTREWGWIKRLSGYLPLTIEEGLTDPELVVVFACIALRRAGKVEPQDVPRVFGELSDAPFGAAITLDAEPEEAGKASPPPSEKNASGDDSGAGSKTNSETSPPTPTSSGTPASATSASPRPMLVKEHRAS